MAVGLGSADLVCAGDALDLVRAELGRRVAYGAADVRFDPVIDTLLDLRAEVGGDAIPDVIVADDALTLDIVGRQVTLHGAPLLPPLTAKEFDLLALLASAPMRAWSAGEILNRVWKYPDGQSAAIYTTVHRTTISRLRARLGGDYIENVREAGYRLIPRARGHACA